MERPDHAAAQHLKKVHARALCQARSTRDCYTEGKLHTSAKMQDVCVAGQLTSAPITNRTTPGPQAQCRLMKSSHQRLHTLLLNSICYARHSCKTNNKCSKVARRPADMGLPLQKGYQWLF